MKNLKVVNICFDYILFEDDIKLSYYHEQDCCEAHYLSFSDLTLEDFEGLEFDLSNDKFFERIEDYGIALKPIIGSPIRIPGYGSNNGYYSADLELVISSKCYKQTYDITDCQDID